MSKSKISVARVELWLVLAALLLPINAIAADIEKLKTSAEDGNLRSQFVLGAYYAAGAGGVKRNEKEAFKWMLKVAESKEQADTESVASAQSFVALAYSTGAGVPTSSASAAKWAETAAGKGNEEAAMLLGILYDKGQGVPQDNMQAYAWFSVAANTGRQPLATTAGNAIAARLSAEELATAQEMARHIEERLPKNPVSSQASADVVRSANLYITSTGVSEDIQTAKWLREACLASASMYGDDKYQLSDKDKQGVVTAWLYIQAIMLGLNKAVWMFMPETPPPLLFIPGKWQGFDVVGPSILSFMQQHADKISDDTPAVEVVAAWYFCEHPDATEEDKSKGLFFLVNAAKKQPESNAKGSEKQQAE